MDDLGKPPADWRAGTFDNLVFQLAPRCMVYKPSGRNQNFQFCGQSFTQARPTGTARASTPCRILRTPALSVGVCAPALHECRREVPLLFLFCKTLHAPTTKATLHTSVARRCSSMFDVALE